MKEVKTRQEVIDQFKNNYTRDKVGSVGYQSGLINPRLRQILKIEFGQCQADTVEEEIGKIYDFSRHLLLAEKLYGINNIISNLNSGYKMESAMIWSKSTTAPVGIVRDVQSELQELLEDGFFTEDDVKAIKEGGDKIVNEMMKKANLFN